MTVWTGSAEDRTRICQKAIEIEAHTYCCFLSKGIRAMVLQNVWLSVSKKSYDLLITLVNSGQHNFNYGSHPSGNTN